MTRIIIATATALVAATTLMSTAANACLSCEYVPEVVRDHATSPLAYGRGDSGSSHSGSSHSEHVTYSARARFSSRDDDTRRSKKTAKIERSEKREKVAKATKSEPKEKVAKASKTVKSEPVEVAKAEPAAKRTETKPAASENSSITIAAAETKKVQAQASVETASRPTDCKKFFASVGMTLTVPCE